MSKANPNPFLPLPGEIVHFRKRAFQSDLKKDSKKIDQGVRVLTIVEAIGEVKEILGDGRVTLKMTSFQDDAGQWVNLDRGVMMHVHLDDIDL